MTGNAIFMAIIAYVFVAILLVMIASITLMLIAKKRLTKGLQERQTFLYTCGFAPFVGLLWLLAAFFIHVQISNRLAHQDCSLSGDPYVTLPNGYVLGSHNTQDGYVVAPGYETDVPATGSGHVRSIIDLQWKDGVFSGTQFDFKDSKVCEFTFDPRDLSIKTFDPGPLN